MADEDDDDEEWYSRPHSPAAEEARREFKRLVDTRTQLLAAQNRKFDETLGVYTAMAEWRKIGYADPVRTDDILEIRMVRRKINDSRPMNGVPATWFFPRLQFYKHIPRRES